MSTRLVRTICSMLVACATLMDLAAAQTPTPAPAPTTQDAANTSASEPANEPAEQNTIVIPIRVSLPTVNVVGSVVSPETLKAARDAGYKIKTADGKTHFCKSEAELPSHFVEERCINEQQLEQVLLRNETQRERLKAMKGGPAFSH